MKFLRNSTILAGLLLVQIPGVALAQSPAPAWTDTHLSADARAHILLKMMTREEKLRLIHGYFPPQAFDKPEAPKNMLPSAGVVPGIDRLGFPQLRESDASLGVANQHEQRKGDVATALPSGLALAATWNPALAYEGGAMIGSEARAKTFNVLLAGGVNLTRDPTNGRNFEYLGEDPLLAGTMAGESIRGVQSNHIVSTIKHFALNAQETGRHVLNAIIDPAALHESDLLAFRFAMERGKPGSVMCAYNRVNGDYACENNELLNNVLKRDWGYSGWVMSDWGAVHSTARAMNAGLDQESGQELDDRIYFAEPLTQATLASGEVSEARLDDMVLRILRPVIANGLVENPVATGEQPIDYDKDAEVSRRVAEEGMVLLKNNAGLLPLTSQVKKILLVGSHADVGVLSGGGSSQVRSVGGVPIEIPLTSGAAASFVRVTYHASSPLKALRAAVPNADITYIDGSDPVATADAAKAADLVIVFAHQWTTEAQDVETFALPDGQDALIDAVSSANTRTVVVLETGGPVLMPWLDRVGAVVQAWYPGQRGGEAIANVLTGKVNPSGRLPVTFPASPLQLPRPEIPGLDLLHAAQAAKANEDKLPAFDVHYPEGANVGYRWFGLKNEKPLFSFGYGLSYTGFSYSDIEVNRTVGQGRGDKVTVSFVVRNTGNRAGADTPQVYISPEGETPGWTIRLGGWEKVSLAAGEAKRVTVGIDPRLLANYDAGAREWTIASGVYRVSASHQAGDTALTAPVRVEAARFADEKLE